MRHFANVSTLLFPQISVCDTLIIHPNLSLRTSNDDDANDSKINLSNDALSSHNFVKYLSLSLAAQINHIATLR